MNKITFEIKKEYYQKDSGKMAFKGFFPQNCNTDDYDNKLNGTTSII